MWLGRDLMAVGDGHARQHLAVTWGVQGADGQIIFFSTPYDITRTNRKPSLPPLSSQQSQQHRVVLHQSTAQPLAEDTCQRGGGPGFRTETKHCDTSLISGLSAVALYSPKGPWAIFPSPGLLHFWIAVHEFQNGPGSLSGL